MVLVSSDRMDAHHNPTMATTTMLSRRGSVGSRRKAHHAKRILPPGKAGTLASAQLEAAEQGHHVGFVGRRFVYRSRSLVGLGPAHLVLHPHDDVHILFGAGTACVLQ
jgi:hypothetical protein